MSDHRVWPRRAAVVRAQRVVVAVTQMLAVVLLHAGALGSQPRTWRLEPEMRIDGDKHELYALGNIVVPNAALVALPLIRANTVLLFDRRGQRVGTLGRPGQGPGEFARMGDGGVLGDTIWFSDGGTRRINFFSATGVFLGSRLHLQPGATPGKGAESPYVVIGPEAILRGGEQIVAATTRGNSNMSARDPTPLVRIDGAGRITDTLFVVPPTESWIILQQPGNGVGRASTPFANTARWAVSKNGSHAALVTAAIDGPNAGTFEVTLVRGNGQTVYRKRFPFELVRIPKAVADSAIDARARLQRSPELAAVARRQLRAPPVYPPIAYIMIGMDGATWVRMKSVADVPGRWHVIDPTGRHTGTVLEPNNETALMSIDHGIWGFVRDSNGVTSVVRFRLAK